MLGVKYARPKRLTPLQKSIRARIQRLMSFSAPKISFGTILVLSDPLASSSRRCWQYVRSEGVRALISRGGVGEDSDCEEGK